VREATATEVTRTIGPHYEDVFTYSRVHVCVLFYLHGDHLGSTAVATNAGGAKTNDVRYYAYGVPRAGDPAALPTDRAFTGQKLDRGTGLMYYGARYYDPALGMFLSPDTVVPEPGNPQGLNRYAYVYNNPLKYTDPSGHFAWFVAVPVGALIGAGVTYGFQVAANISQNGLNVQAFT